MVEMLLHTQYYFSNKYKVLYENILQLEEEKFISIFLCICLMPSINNLMKNIFADNK